MRLTPRDLLQAAALAGGLSVAAVTPTTPAARAQQVDVNTSQKTGDDNECAISKNPTNPAQLFVSCNTSTAGLFAARSTDGGATWTYPDAADRTIADGDAGQGPAACCDPTTAWDTFGNLFLTYLDAGPTNVVTILSTDGGATFTNLASFAGSVDQPTVVAANTTAPGAPVAVWVVWNQSGSMVARGAAVTGLGAVGAFGALQNIPGTANCSFGDIAIAPSGAVVQGCQSPVGGQGPATIVINTDADGLGAGNFGAAVNASTTNVGGFDFIPAQPNRSVDPETGLAYDNAAASPNFGRLYLLYTEETAPENNDLDVMVRFSDNDGATWSAPIRVNDDPPAPIRSQFLPKIAVDDNSGRVSLCWHDCRNSATNTAMEVFCAEAPPTGATPTFSANVLISDGASTTNGSGMDFGDYSGLDVLGAVAHPVWGDTSNSTGDNPNGTANFDALTDRFSAGPGPQIQVPGGVDLGNTCSNAHSSGTLNVCNTGKDDLIVDAITSSNPAFSVVEPSAGFPVTVSPDFCFPFQVAFDATAAGAQTGTLTIPSNDSMTPSTMVEVTATGAEADIRVTGSPEFGVVSAWTPGEKTLSVCNTGACDLVVTSAVVACPDFTLVHPFPATVSHDSCLDVVARFEPLLAGRTSCGLAIASNDPDTPVASVTLTGRTPPFLSLHAGLATPHGTLNATTNQGSTLNLGFVYPLRPRWAWDIRLGWSRLDGQAANLDTDVSTLSGNARFTINPAAPLRVFVNGGLGVYHFDPGAFEGGGNLGLGLNVPLGQRFALEATYNYHSAFTASPDLEYDQVQLGILVSF